MSLDDSKEQESIWLRGGTEWFLRYEAFYEVKWEGMARRNPLLVSLLDASHHKEQEYIYALGFGI